MNDKTKTPDLFGHPETTLTKIETLEEVVEFLTAGKAKFTIRSHRSGQHFTYKIVKVSDQQMYYVSRLGADNNYIYMGVIWADSKFTATRKTSSYARQYGWTAFEWLWEKLQSGILPEGVTIYHVGRCGMCGLELTDPVSIKQGYGPECQKKRVRS